MVDRSILRPNMTVRDSYVYDKQVYIEAEKKFIAYNFKKDLDNGKINMVQYTEKVRDVNLLRIIESRDVPLRVDAYHRHNRIADYVKQLGHEA